LPERTGELLAHHQRRLEEIKTLLAEQPDRPLSGYAIASRMSWSRRRTWDDLSGFEHRLAVTEALAHIELLHARGEVHKEYTEGQITYRVPMPQ
jgi:hypothetical protein